MALQQTDHSRQSTLPFGSVQEGQVTGIMAVEDSHSREQVFVLTSAVASDSRDGEYTHQMISELRICTVA